MLPSILNHIWQSTLCLIILGALTLLFRRNSAVVRYRLWLIASVKFLVPFSLFVALGGMVQWHPVRTVTVSEVPVVVRQISQPFTPSPVSIPTRSIAKATPVARPSLGVAFASVWLGGAVAVLLVWFFRWLQIARIVRSADPLDASGKSSGIRILTSRAGMEPGVFGIFRPVLLLPEGLARNLPAVQLEPIIAHEMFHVRGRDNLAAAMHTVVQALFWFHPLVWWLGNRLVDERERACDEAVLQSGHDPADYAEGILKVCKSNLMMPACVAGVSGSNLKKRIEVIMENRGTRGLTPGKKLLLTVAGAGALIVPVFTGMMSAAQSPISGVHATLLPVVSQAPADHAATLPVIESATVARLPALQQTPVPAPQAGQTANGQQKWSDDVSIIIMTDEERKAFQQLTDEEQRQNFIRNFWLARDPTPGTPANEFKAEYDRRVAYANEHFTTQSGTPGSQTDRGKMYILYGPPDAILPRTIDGSSPFGVIRSAPIEMWNYRHIDGKGDNLVFEFVDRQTNGGYTLVYDPLLNSPSSRVAYANEHFTSKSGIPGSKTDRGKMYILNGPPDEILSHPSGGTYYRPADQGDRVTRTFPFEQWRYRHVGGKGENVIYEFVDKQENGEYTLEYDPNARNR
jgi:GWxTD domain-containing protein